MNKGSDNRQSNIHTFPSAYTHDELRKKAAYEAFHSRRLKVIVTIGIIFLGFLTFTCFNLGHNILKVNQDIAVVNKEIEQVKKDQVATQQEVLLFLNHDYVMKYAREKYFMSYPGETLFNIRSND